MSPDDIFSPYRSPDWYPLQRALASVFGAAAADASAAFWFVGFVNGPVDVGELRRYEHSSTRRMLVLDSHGNAYRWMESVGAYVRTDEEEALVETLV